MRNKKTEFAFLVISVLMCLVAICMMFSHKTEATVIVDRVDFQQEILGGSENIRTEYYYRVYTDKGIFEIAQKGALFAHPELISKVHQGDTLSITARGYNLVVLGIYPFIVEVHDKK